ncbi:hypothetical protein ScPMuIL_010916 [Solemya velum]
MYRFVNFKFERKQVNTRNNKMIGSTDRRRFQSVSIITSSNTVGKCRFAQMTLGHWNKGNYKGQPSSAPRAYVIQKNGSYQKVTKIDLATIRRGNVGSSQEQKMAMSNINACYRHVQKPSRLLVHEKRSNVEAPQAYLNMMSPTQGNVNSDRNMESVHGYANKIPRTASIISRSNGCCSPANERDYVEIPWFLQDYTGSNSSRSNAFYGTANVENGVEIPWFLQDYTGSNSPRSNTCCGSASEENHVKIHWFRQDYTGSNTSPLRSQSGLKSFLENDCAHRPCSEELTCADGCGFEINQNRSPTTSDNISEMNLCRSTGTCDNRNDDRSCLDMETISSSDTYLSSWFGGEGRGHRVPGTPQKTQPQRSACGGSTSSDESYQTAIGEYINDDWTYWSDVDDQSSWSDDGSIGHNYSVSDISKSTQSSPSSYSDESYQTAAEEYMNDNSISWTDVEYDVEGMSVYRLSAPRSPRITQSPSESKPLPLLSESWEYYNDDGFGWPDVRLRADCDPSIWFHKDDYECRYSAQNEPQMTQLQPSPYMLPSTSNHQFKTTAEECNVQLISCTDDWRTSDTCIASPEGVLIQALISISVPELEQEDVVFELDAGNEQVLLGKGAFGRVSLATLKSQQNKVVVKEFTERLTVLDQILHEARILLYLEKTNTVPKCYGLMPISHGLSQAALVQECIGGGMTLQRLLNNDPLLVDQAGWLDICLQLAIGLDAIHEQQVLLNDIKYDNILIDCESPCVQAKFIDMGYASFRKPHIFVASEHTLERYFYLAPEIRRGEATSIKSDIYSLGYVYGHVVREAGCSLLAAISQKCQRKRPKDRPSTKTLINVISDILL